jgi:hypothetical protein
VTSTEIGPATGKTQIHNFIYHCANQARTQNVQGRMFDCLLVACRQFRDRAKELFAEQEFGRELTARWLRPRGTTAVMMTFLSLVTLAYCTGVPVQHLDQRAHYGLIRIWSTAEHKLIQLQNRARQDYQSLQLIYQMTRQIRNLPEPQELCKRRDRATKAIARNRLPCSGSPS